jgi:dsRNA-specific ribonuclease
VAILVLWKEGATAPATQPATDDDNKDATKAPAVTAMPVFILLKGDVVGDRVLGLLMAEWLAERFPREQEGDLGRRLALLVSQPVLAAVAEEIGLGEALSVAPGEVKAGVRRRATVLADALEAALGALYLDGGLERAREFVQRAWDGVMTRLENASAIT